MANVKVTKPEPNTKRHRIFAILKTVLPSNMSLKAWGTNRQLKHAKFLMQYGRTRQPSTASPVRLLTKMQTVLEIAPVYGDSDGTVGDVALRVKLPNSVAENWFKAVAITNINAIAPPDSKVAQYVPVDLRRAEKAGEQDYGFLDFTSYHSLAITSMQYILTSTRDTNFCRTCRLFLTVEQFTSEWISEKWLEKSNKAERKEVARRRLDEIYLSLLERLTSAYVKEAKDVAHRPTQEFDVEGT